MLSGRSKIAEREKIRKQHDDAAAPVPPQRRLDRLLDGKISTACDLFKKIEQPPAIDAPRAGGQKQRLAAGVIAHEAAHALDVHQAHQAERGGQLLRPFELAVKLH